MNLAVAYGNRILGNRADNLEQAIQCYQLALSVRTREAYPEQWATTQLNLAGAYQTRNTGDRSANVEESIECYRLALSVYTRDAYPEDWAMTQMNLAVAYSERIRGERAANVEDAIECYRLALSVRTRDAYPEDWAMTQMNLANTYSNRIQGEREANIEEAIECYGLALSVYTRDAYPEQWARTQENIAVLYMEEGDNNLAISHYHQALEVFQPEAFPINALKANRGMGSIYFKQGNWQQAIDSYDLAIKAVETSRSWATTDESRQLILRQALSVYENAIQSSINLGRIDRAIEYSERARSRQIVDFMQTRDLYADGEIPAEIEHYLAEYEALERQIQTCRLVENDEMISSNRTSIRLDIDRVLNLEAQKQATWQKIRQLDPILAGQQQVLDIKFSDIQSLITNLHTAILSFFTTDDDTHIFIMTQDCEPQVYTCKGQGWQNFQLWLQERWLIPYAENRDDWISTFPTVLVEISQRIQLDRLVAKLTNISEIIIIPHLLLHQIPFAALPVSLKTEHELLSDRFTIHYAPSCQILKYCQDRPSIDRLQHGMVENTNGTLPGAIFECQEIAAILKIPNSYRLIGRQQSTIANFNALLPLVTDLHLAHHAVSRLDNPLESSLQLADGNITLAKLMMSRFPQLDEVFLSCCETALGNVNITDDLLTIATGFLCAGARNVIGTLWAVSDLSTSLLAIFYYEGCRDGFSSARSLNMAQVRLRNLTGEEFETNYHEAIKKNLAAYKTVNTQYREDLDKQFDRGEISKVTYVRELGRLTNAYEFTIELIDSLDRYCQADRPFAHPYYWAAFTCQGLG